MGFGIKIKAPKIKIGNPAKLVTNAVKGVTNAQTDIIKSQIDGLSQVSGSALGAVGGVLSNPAAAPLLGAAGAAFGVPEVGLLGGLFGGSKNTAGPSPAPVIEEYATPTAMGSQGISKTMIIAGASALGLILLVVLFLSKRKR